MFKKILILLVILLCVSCGKHNDEVKEEIEVESIDEYIDPVKDIFLFDELNEELKKKIKVASGSKEFKNYQFEMLFKDVYNKPLIDIDGNTINLADYDELVVEVVSVKCSHCKKQIENIDDFLHDDATFIQYFNVGNKEDIIELYKEAEVEIPENIIIVSKDDEFKDYLMDELKLEMYPSLLTFKDGRLTFSAYGEIYGDTIGHIYDIGFDNILTRNDLTDEDGIFLLDINRSFDDVKNSLSRDNLERLQMLDNDEKTVELTISVIGSRFDFKTMSNSDSKLYINEVDDFDYYKDKKLVIIYTYLKDENDVEKIEYINNLISQNKGYEYMVALSEGLESSSTILENMDVRFDCPVVSLSARIPDDFSRVGYISYPSAVFVDKGVFTGVYSNIQQDAFKNALEWFLSDKSIAYKKNN